MVEAICIIVVLVIVALFVIPTDKRPVGCICEYSVFGGPTVQDDCPVHRGWAEPLYPIEEIKAAFPNPTEREKACIKHGLDYNKILREKHERK